MCDSGVTIDSLWDISSQKIQFFDSLKVFRAMVSEAQSKNWAVSIDVEQPRKSQYIFDFFKDGLNNPLHENSPKQPQTSREPKSDRRLDSLGNVTLKLYLKKFGASYLAQLPHHGIDKVSILVKVEKLLGCGEVPSRPFRLPTHACLNLRTATNKLQLAATT
jgi:hypothetical protein